MEGMVGVELDFGEVEGPQGRIVVFKGGLIVGKVLRNLSE